MPSWPKDNQSARNAFYGDPGKGEIDPQLIRVTPPFGMQYDGKPIKSFLFHRKAAPALMAALNEIWDYCQHDQAKIDQAGVSQFNGAYNHRMVRGSATKWSNHAYGTAIDLNALNNALGVSKGTMPQFVVDAFCRQGAMWGGWYQSRPDWMHFEFVDNGGRRPKSMPPIWPRHAALVSDEADYSDGVEYHVEADDGPAPAPKPDHLPPPAESDKTIVEVEFTPLPGTVGDARVFYAQTRLKTFNISPGVIDGKWGGATAAAMARFINDRNRTDIDAPTSFPEFLESFSETFPELRKASIEGWRVKVTEDRKEAKPEVVAQVAPEVVPTQKAESVSTWAGFGAAIAAVWAAVKDYLEQAWNLLTDYKDSGIWNAVADRAASVPVWLWFAGGAGILLFIASQSKQAREISTQGVKSGERV